MEKPKENEKISIKIERKKPVKVKDIFGMLKDWKKPTEEIMKEARRGWLSASDREREAQQEDPLESLGILGKEKLKHKSIQQLKKEARREIEEDAYRKTNSKFEHCDFKGACKNKAYREVYPMLLKGKHQRRGWSYLCRKHYFQEQEKYKGKLPSASVD